MANESKTTYLVETVYQTVDKTSRPAGEIEKSLVKAGEAAQSLQSILKGLTAAFLGSRAFHEAKKLFIDYNAEIEQHRTVLAGMLTMYTGVGIDKTWERAALSVERFTEMAKKSSLTTRDLVNTAAGLTRPLLQAGLTMKDIEDLTFGVANAAKAFGTEATAALDIEQAIGGRLGARDRFAQSLLGQKDIGLNYAQFNKLSMDKRIETLKKALTSESIVAMAKKQGEDTFGGVMSTLEDNFQILGSRVGLPLFKAITNEVKGWNAWIDRNQRKIAEIGQEVGKTLVSGFRHLKDALAWVYDHSGTLINVAKAYAAIKIGSMVSSGVAGTLAQLGGGAGGVMGFLSKGGWQNVPGEVAPQFVQPGAGRMPLSRLGAAGMMQFAPLIGAAAGAGFALGHLINDMTGLSETITNTKKINGEVLDITDKTTAQYANLLTSMKAFDRAVLDASDRLSGVKGAGGTMAAAGLAGYATVKAQQANIVQDLIRSGGFEGGALERAKTQLKLEKTGRFDSDEIAKIMASPQSFANKLSQQAMAFRTRETEASKSADLAWESIPSELKKSLDQSKVLQALMQKTLQLMPQTPGGFSQGIILSKDQIAEALKSINESADIKGQAKVNQTVNITIQQVMAKDPNRWIADMDDMVARRARNPTRAKNAWKTTVK